jgi:hypothetical protein
MGFEPGFRWPPLRLARVRCDRESPCVVCPAVPDVEPVVEEGVLRAIGLGVHRDFCGVGLLDACGGRARGRIATTPADLELFARSPGPDDRVAPEATGNAWEIARIIEPHVARVIVVSPSDTGSRQARAKTDRLDAIALAKLLAAGSLDALWMPDERTGGTANVSYSSLASSSLTALANPNRNCSRVSGTARW